MNLKKVAALFVSCTLAGTLFTGCGDTAASAQNGSIKLGMLKNLNITESRYTEIMKSVEEDSGIKLNPHQVVFYDNLPMLKMAMDSGSVDEGTAYKSVANYIMSQDPQIEMAPNHVGNQKLSDSFAFAMRAEDTGLKNSVSAVIEEMKKDGTLENLTETYITKINPGEDPPAVAFETFDGADTIKVGVTGDLPPLDLVLPDGTPAGFNTAMLAEIGKRLQKNIELVLIDSAARATALSSKKIDISFWAIVPINSNIPSDVDKPKGVEFSTTYFTDDIIHITIKK